MSVTLFANSYMSLSGQWLFKYVSNAASADSLEATGFYRPDYSAASFDRITVPSCWAILGYEEPVYREFGDAPHSEGFYIRHFRVPQSMSGQRVLLRFGGVWASAEVWLNGHRLGRHDSGFTSFAFDISKYVKADSDNVVAVRVRQVYPGYVTDTYDDWSLGGIFRDVTIESMPAKRWIEKVTVTTDFDADYRDADLHVSTMVNDQHKTTLPGNYRSPGDPYRLHYLLTDKNGLAVVDTTITVPAHTATSRLVETVFHIAKPMQWTAETPYLYKLTVEAGASAMTVPVGFREISTEGGVFRINGQAVKLRGVNRHDEWPTVGRATTREHWLKDITMMKEANINYVRACHYQHAKGFIELCDSLGMYVGEEVSLGGAGCLMTDPSFTGAMMTRVSETVERDLNDPCIIYWSVGNEDSFNEMYYEAARTVKALDPTRPVLYPWNADTTLPRDIDILAPHYWTAAQYDSLCRHGDRPVITTEYVHAYGTQRFGGLEDCWRALHDNAHGAGGAVWMWADQGIVTPTEWTDKKYESRAGGNRHLRVSSAGWDGITDSWRNPTRDYWEVKNVYAPVYPTGISSSASSRLTIHNDYDFISTKGIVITYKVFVDAKLKNEGTAELDIAPHADGELAIKTNIKKLKPGQTAYVQLFFTKDGKEIARRSVVLGASNGQLASPTLSKRKGAFAGDAKGLTSNLLLEASGKTSWSCIPTIWHKLNEGDLTIKNRTFDGEKYRAVVTGTDTTETAEGIAVTTVEDCVINDSNHFVCSYTVTTFGNGSCRVDYDITPHLTTNYLPLVGMKLKIQPKQWLGLGPDEAWPNKKAAGILGVWDATGFTGTRDAQWLDTADGYRITLDGEGYIDRDSADSQYVRIVSHVLGRAEKGRLNDPRYRLEPGKTYHGSFTITKL